jgi:hypothetical protein
MRRRLIEAEITDFVNDEKPWLSEHFHGVGQPTHSEGSTKPACHFHGGQEARDDVRVQR